MESDIGSMGRDVCLRRAGIMGSQNLGAVEAIAMVYSKDLSQKNKSYVPRPRESEYPLVGLYMY